MASKEVKVPGEALKEVPAPEPGSESPQTTTPPPVSAPKVWKFKNEWGVFTTAPLASGKMEAIPPNYVIETTDSSWAARLEKHIASRECGLKKLS